MKGYPRGAGAGYHEKANTFQKLRIFRCVQDADEVALAAIQGLHQLMQQKDVELRRQDAEIATLKRDLDAIRAKLGM